MMLASLGPLFIYHSHDSKHGLLSHLEITEPRRVRMLRIIILMFAYKEAR